LSDVTRSAARAVGSRALDLSDKRYTEGLLQIRCNARSDCETEM